jgi:hypothetical protein
MPDFSSGEISGVGFYKDFGMLTRRMLRGKQDEKTYCLTGECSPDFDRWASPPMFPLSH